MAALVTHPVQYFAPVFRTLAARDDLTLRVFFGCPHGLSGEVDPFFKQPVAWDTRPDQGFEREFVSQGPLEALRGRPGAALGADAAKLIRAWRPDAALIFSYSPAFITAATVCLAMKNVPLMLRAETSDVDHDRSGWKNAVRDGLLRRYYRRFAHFFPIGTNSRNHYLRLGVPEKRMTTAEYAVDAAFFKAQAAIWNPRRDALRAEAGIAPGDKALLFCGKLHEPKDPLLLAAALEKLDSETAGRTWLYVVGDGEMRGQVETRAKDVLGSRAVFTGFQNQSGLGRYYAMCDALVLPSKTGETWGLVVNEALSFGLFALASSRVGSAGDLIEPGLNGFVFQTGNADELASCVARLFTARPFICQSRPLPAPGDLARAVAGELGKIAGARR